jgi:hypothetical protein
MTAEEAVKLVVTKFLNFTAAAISFVVNIFFFFVSQALAIFVGIGVFAQVPMFLVLGYGGEWDVFGVVGLFTCDLSFTDALKVMESCRIAGYAGTPFIGLNKMITWVLDTNIAVLAISVALFILLPLSLFFEKVLGLKMHFIDFVFNQ